MCDSSILLAERESVLYSCLVELLEAIPEKEVSRIDLSRASIFNPSESLKRIKYSAE